MIRWFDRVKALLKARKIKYEVVGEVLGVSKGSVSHYLNGRYEPSIRQLKLLAGILDMSLSEMIGDDAFFITSPSEKAAVLALRNIPEGQRGAAQALLEAMAASQSGSPGDPENA